MQEKNTDNDENELKQSTNIKKKVEEKKEESNTKDSDKKSFKTSFKEFRGEFKKIIWPSRSELVKKTVTVVITSLSFGLLVFAMDTVFSLGYTTFIDLLTKI